MQKLPHSRRVTIIALLQSAMALLAWWVYYSVFLFLGPGIDFDKPGHQMSVFERFAEATVVVGLPVIWSTVAAFFMWFRAKGAWWLCVTGDIAAVCVGIVFLRSDASTISDLRKYPALLPDVLYHLAVLFLPAVALGFLMSRSMRAQSLASFKKITG